MRTRDIGSTVISLDKIANLPNRKIGAIVVHLPERLIERKYKVNVPLYRTMPNSD